LNFTFLSIPDSSPVHLELPWFHPKTILGPSRGHSGPILGHPRANLGPFWGEALEYTVFGDFIAKLSSLLCHLPSLYLLLERGSAWLGHVKNAFTYLNTIGAGTQNLMRIFLMLSFKFFSSKYHEACSLAPPPAVGSGPPIANLISLS